MVIVVAIMTILLVAALGVICYQRMMVDRLNESWESAFENVSENLEACVQTLKSELEGETLAANMANTGTESMARGFHSRYSGRTL